MSKFIFLFLSLVLFSSNVFSQNEISSAPVKWQRYKVSNSSISFVMPKLPIRVDSQSPCEETQSSNYSAYANDAVYSVIVYSKSSEKNPANCKSKVKFGNDTISKIKEVTKQSMKDFEESETSVNGKKAAKFSTQIRNTWIVDDLENNYIYEVSISRRDSANVDEKQFLESISNDSNKSGIEIGNGAIQVFGDEGVSLKNQYVKPESGEKSNIENLITIGRPKPFYTDSARKNNIQGIVIVRVTFLANGGIGEIEVVKPLENGLTERAIEAAKKMTFLPVKRNGINQTVVKQVQYSFSIY